MHLARHVVIVGLLAVLGAGLSGCVVVPYGYYGHRHYHDPYYGPR